MPTRRATFVGVSQVVKDVKLPSGNAELAIAAGELRARLHALNLIPGDKVNARMEVREIDPDGTVSCVLHSGCLAWRGSTKLNIEQPFPLRLTGYTGEMDPISVFGAVPGVEIDGGGNVQNMTLNLLTMLAALEEALPEAFGPAAAEVVIASSSDPLNGIDDADRLRRRLKYVHLPMDDRYAIQVPWAFGGAGGRLSITSVPERTSPALGRLLADDPEFAEMFDRAACVVTSDVIGDYVDRISGKPAYVINPSSALRPEVACATAKRSAILPMNQDEASEVIRILLAQAQNEELNKIPLPLFPSPLSTCGTQIDHAALCELDKSLVKARRYNPPFQRLIGPSYSWPITFGRQGGLVIGGGENLLFCFSSVPTDEGEARLLDEYADPSKTLSGSSRNDVGAGDSVAAVIALFNTVDPEVLISEHMIGQENNFPLLADLASTIFVSVTGRLMGNLLVRTTKTYLANIAPDKLVALLRAAAKSSLEAARTMVKSFNDPVLGEIKPWGIRFVVWWPGRAVSASGVEVL